MNQSSDTVHELRIFAFHIQCLATAVPGSKLGLSFWGGVKVQIEVRQGLDEEQFYINGECVGNINGATQKYAELCAPAFENHQEKE